MANDISSEALRLAVDGMLEGIQIISYDWRYLYVNMAAAKQGMSTPDALAGKTMMEAYPGFEKSTGFQDLKYVMDSRNPRRVENQFEYPDTGKKCWFELHIEPHTDGILVRSLDITDRKLLEEQFRHAQRIEAVGQLAGGIAHEFNNKLGTMMMYTEMLMDRLPNDETANEYLNYIMNAVEQSSNLTKKILAFSRKQVLDLEVANLNLLVKQMNPTLINLIGANIQIDHNLDRKIENVKVDADQMEQAILNLCINARDAISGSGKITIETANVELDEEYSKAHPSVKPGKYVMIAISDTGHGMSKETMAKVFEPFFTTKSKDRGTGLGLAMVHGFVHQSNGHIWVYSEVGMGTVFKIYLPAISEIPAYQSEAKPKSVSSYKGNETILLVEDDNLLRKAYDLALSHAGYKVLTASDGLEGKRICLGEGEKINLLLTDVVLPKMKGQELVAEVRKSLPNLKVIFMSGYTENSIVHEGVLETDSILLQKPISIRNLLETVRKVLDGALTKGVI